MAIVCTICKKEVHLVSFGGGFVGTCCNRVLYNAAIKPQFDIKKGRQKIFYPLIAIGRKVCTRKTFLTT